jgi:hypothetical protein
MENLIYKRTTNNKKELMKDASEEEDDDFIMTTEKMSSRKHDGRMSMAQRKAKLNRMMDEDGM